MHLGPPPLLLPIKRHEDIGAGSEEDGVPRLSKSIPNKVLVFYNRAVFCVDAYSIVYLNHLYCVMHVMYWC